MSSENHIPPAKGTRQDQRAPTALDPKFAPLDHRSPAQFMTDARNIAEKLAFWTTDNSQEPRFSWADFLPKLEGSSLQAAEADAAQAAQKALFLTYLKLYRHAQEDLNHITERHLDFYYKQVLRLQPLLGQPDLAHLALTLKKSVAEARIPLGTLFTTANKLTYRSTEEVFLRQSQIKHIRTIYHHPVTQCLYAAAASNSIDGLGGDLPEDDPSWHPFGHQRSLPFAECGFALSSPLLVMRQGIREITVILKLEFSITPPTDALVSSYFSSQLTASLSGEKTWIPAGIPTVQLTKTGSRSVTVTLVYTLTHAAAAVSPYNLTLLSGAFDTLAPVMKWSSSTQTNNDNASALRTAILREVSLKISVRDMKDVDLENDHGKIDASKPFYPFGPLPHVGSSFYIGAEEALHKNVTMASLTLGWKNPPSNFGIHYLGYPNASSITNSYFTTQFQILKDGQFVDLSPDAKPLFHATNPSAQITIHSTAPALSGQQLTAIQYSRNFSKKVRQAKVELPFSQVTLSRPLTSIAVVPILAFRSIIELPVLQGRSKLTAKSHKGFLRLRLKQSFGQDVYAATFATAVSHNSNPANAAASAQKKVPNIPYLPEISTFALSYEAETAITRPNLNDEASFLQREIRVFHLYPFGQREEHGYLRSTVGVSDPAVTLLPSIEGEGQLLLGITDLAGDQTISLLFQVKDGTADPNSTRQKIAWSILASNHWRPLEDHQILLDTTQGFLKSGIVRVLIPRTASIDNTLLEPNLTWLRATIMTASRATCRLISIHPNAIPTTLTDTTLASHLESGLPAKSIIASATPLRGVKEITQPYPSSGGAAPEQATSFRTRVAERLRHRGRASSAWDYERLILQNFPKIYQALALNHTNRLLERQAGHVSIVVLPDRRASESASSLTPQVDIGTLAEINDFLTRVSSPFVTAVAINPVFEPIYLAFRVAFRSGLPFSSYKEILRQDLQAKLAPWAFQSQARADAVSQLHRSALIAFIDSQPYVDYLTHCELFHQPTGSVVVHSVQTVTASRLGAILTPTAAHQILPIL